MTKLAWKPWHQVVSLRDDLRTGDLSLNQFAADLYEVLMQRGARPIYEKPAEFFALTYPTYNLRQLAREVVLRLAGQNDKAVRQLALTYGGGKTHTLITLFHLVNDPEHLPDLPAVHEFVTEIGRTPPKARVAALCADKLDVEKGMEVRSPCGETRWLKQPWSVLAYQIAGDEGLKLLSATGSADERESAPAENLLQPLLALPGKEGLATLVLIDELLMFATEKIALAPEWRHRLVNFCQYLTQAATKVDRCCIVASLLASDPRKSDRLGKEIQGELYDIFQREREEIVEPVVKQDVAEVLRRRFFKPDSIRDVATFRPRVVEALKGIGVVDPQTQKEGATAEERFLASYPFHPDLTEVLYSKWTNLERFQRTRGVLRTFALALREAEKWDQSPLIGANVFLAAPGAEGLSEAARELVTVAETEEYEGRRQSWAGILVGELGRARQVQIDSVGLKFREMEQAVFATFLHSQPIGQSAQTPELMVLLGATRPDRIELEKGLRQWAACSHWLDDSFTVATGDQLPSAWRLGNRPNLTQMHDEAMRSVQKLADARLIDEIQKAKLLTAGAQAAGVRVHLLPDKPNDVEDNGEFHYVVLGPKAASASGKPSAEAKRFLDETTGPEKPRVFRNAVVIAVPAREGLEMARNRVLDYLAWEEVHNELKKQEGEIEGVRMASLRISLDKAKKAIPGAIRQAYCIVVTVGSDNEVQAFKISVPETDDPLFNLIKSDKRSRIQDTAVTADALLPGGPYDLWHEGDTSRRVKDLVGAFAQLPHLPKMLATKAILDTLVSGCVQGGFVLRLVRPDRSFRTWWKATPDEEALKAPALEVVLPEAAELSELSADLLAPDALSGLWSGDQIQVKDVMDYFSGSKVIQVPKEGYTDAVRIPKAGREVVEGAIQAAVRSGKLWLLSGPASILGEEIPTGVLTDGATLRKRPLAISATEILSETLPDAWEGQSATALSIATALHQKQGVNLPWTVVRDVIDAALRASFVELDTDSSPWPCELAGAQTIKLKMPSGGPPKPKPKPAVKPGMFAAEAELEPNQIQDLGDLIPELLKLKAKANLNMKFHLRFEAGNESQPPDQAVIDEINKLLEGVQEGFELKK
jgi:hypothetical protein